MYKSLKDFIARLEREGELIRVSAPVSSRFEIAELTDRQAKSEGGGKALLFENTDAEFPVVTNMMGSSRRMAMALGVERLEDIGSRIEALLGDALSPKASLWDKMKMLPLLADVAKWFPKNISGRGACQEVVWQGDEVDLERLPMLHSWESDGGAFVTLPMVNTIDPESGMHHGISVYYGYALPGAALDILSVGNEVRIVGLMQFYEAGGAWQISGLTHNLMKPQDPGNCQKISEGNKPAYVLTDAETFVSGQVTLENGETRSYAEMALATSLEVRNLTVESVYTTTDEESSSKGAMTLTCKVGDTTVLVRTIVLKDANGDVITADAFEGKTIDVKGIVDFFDGAYQIKVFSANDITIYQ